MATTLTSYLRILWTQPKKSANGSNIHSRSLVLVHVGEKGLPVVILNAPASEVKDRLFPKQRSFAAAQDDKPERNFRYLVL